MHRRRTEYSHPSIDWMTNGFPFCLSLRLRSLAAIELKLLWTIVRGVNVFGRRLPKTQPRFCLLPMCRWRATGESSHKTIIESSHGKCSKNFDVSGVGNDSVVYGAVDLPGRSDQGRTGHGGSMDICGARNRWQKAADLPELAGHLALEKPPTSTRGWGGLGVKPEALRRMKVFSGLDDRQIERLAVTR